jgi:hypothetical protein
MGRNQNHAALIKRPEENSETRNPGKEVINQESRKAGIHSEARKPGSFVRLRC